MELYRKVYGVYGMVEWSTLIPAGGGNIRIDFTNGCLSTRGIDPATFSTDNLAVQVAIENSPRFRGGKIKLVSKYVIGETKDSVLEEKSKTRSESSESDFENKETVVDSGGERSVPFAEVKNSQQAKAVLMESPYNVPLAELGSKSAIQEKAAELNVVFPNWK